jgi:hypothetical protein
MYTLNKSKEQHPMIRPGKYKGLQSAYYLTILFDNGNKSEPIEMEGGVRGLDCSMDVTVSVDGTITAS